MDNIKLNVSFLRKRVPNLTIAAKEKGLRPATVSNLCTGKTPVGRAEVRTLVALAELAECKIDDLIIRDNEVQMIETGIKALDFLAPITRGGINGFIARPGMGQLVLLAEIFYRLRDKDFTTVLLIPYLDSPDLKEVKETSNILSQDTNSAYKKIIDVKENQDVVLAVDRSLVVSGEIYSLLEKLKLPKEKTITTFLIDPTGEAVDEELPYGPLDTIWHFDAELVSRKLFPAINPVSSTSVITEGAQLDKKHFNLQQRARKIMRRYRELRFLVNAFGYDKLQFPDKEIYNRGLRLESYLTQAFFVSEPFTKKNGASVSLSDTLEDVSRILDGQLDEVNNDRLLYIGSLYHIT
ncbi:ATP synthase subunit B [Paucisalibacillus sp. EB02]|uniref:ATP synthase subunit B n=1 Tax=Paucisalibacillus sp. EB02 TaxID=1347087 RepID=UPI0004BABF51|nr:ATP synthase subunit B [Paucisalibacillus sp. EB02]